MQKIQGIFLGLVIQKVADLTLLKTRFFGLLSFIIFLFERSGSESNWCWRRERMLGERPNFQRYLLLVSGIPKIAILFERRHNQKTIIFGIYVGFPGCKHLNLQITSKKLDAEDPDDLSVNHHFGIPPSSARSANHFLQPVVKTSEWEECVGPFAYI